MKKFLVILLAAGFFAAAVPSQTESARPVGVFKCRHCGAVVEIPYDYNTNKIPNPSEVGYAKGCKKSTDGEHKWWALRTRMR